MRLTIHPRAQVRPVGEGLPFLGFVVYPEARRLKRRKGIHFRRKLQRQLRDYARGELALDKITASVQGWVNHVRFGNTSGLREAVLGACVVPPPQISKTAFFPRKARTDQMSESSVQSDSAQRSRKTSGTPLDENR